MRLLTSSILLTLTVLVASCSKNQYAQVEPDDLYFTKKDRQEVVNGANVPTSPAVTAVQPTEVPTENQRSEYSEQHAPVFTNPAYGSPTIQAYGQQPYYDTSVNPDYLYEDEYTATEAGSTEYYNEDYAYQAPPVYETPQVNNYYYGLPTSTYMPMSAMMGIGVYSWNRPMRYYDMNMCDPFWGSYSRFVWMNRLGYDPYYGTYISNNGFHYSYYSGNPYYYGYAGNYYGYGGNYYGYGGNNNTYYNGDTYYAGGTKVVTKPRQSRSQGTSEVDKTNLPIKSRRADYIPSTGEESGRVATSTANSRTSGDRSSYTRRGSSPTYYTGTQQRTNNRSSATIKDSRGNISQRTRTVVVPTKTQPRTSYANRGNASQKSNTRTYNANRSSVNRSGATNRSSGATRYSTRTTNANRNSYGTRSSSGSRSNTSYGSRSSSTRSSGNRSSYSSGRSSSRSSVSRSSGSSSRSSYSPSRSSSSRSSGSRSSGSSSSGRSSGRKN